VNWRGTEMPGGVIEGGGKGGVELKEKNKKKNERADLGKWTGQTSSERFQNSMEE